MVGETKTVATKSNKLGEAVQSGCYGYLLGRGRSSAWTYFENKSDAIAWMRRSPSRQAIPLKEGDFVLWDDTDVKRIAANEKIGA